MKMFQVEDETHEEGKAKAKNLKMSIKDYIAMLISSDNTESSESYTCNEFNLELSDERVSRTIKQPDIGKNYTITIKDCVKELKAIEKDNSDRGIFIKRRRRSCISMTAQK